MKKIGIITILDITNFGSILQAYALGYVIESFGYKVVFINYWRKAFTTSNKVKTFLKDKTLGNVVRRITYALAALTFYSALRIRIRRILRSRFSFTNKFTSFEQLKKYAPNFDVAISGSDQIWNSSYNGGIDSSFFLDFVSCPRIAYAASSGLEKFDENELDKITSLLRKYDYISVREFQTKDYLASLGFHRTKQVLDPSLLLSADKWCDILDIKDRYKEKYLLVYSVERFNNDFIFSQAKKLAHEMGLKVYVVCATYPVEVKKYKFDKIFSLASIYTFLELLRGASFVVVSSFHGTAFSINFNKDFITISPNKFNIRMDSIMKLFALEERIVRDSFVTSESLCPIDWHKVNNKLSIVRDESLIFLKDTIAECISR